MRSPELQRLLEFCAKQHLEGPCPDHALPTAPPFFDAPALSGSLSCTPVQTALDSRAEPKPFDDVEKVGNRRDFQAGECSTLFSGTALRKSGPCGAALSDRCGDSRVLVTLRRHAGPTERSLWRSSRRQLRLRRSRGSERILREGAVWRGLAFYGGARYVVPMKISTMLI